MSDGFRESIFCLSLKFNDSELEARFKRYQINQGVDIARTVFLITMIYMAVLTAIHFSGIENELAFVTLFGLIASVSCLLMTLLCKTLVPFIGYFFMTVYLLAPTPFHIHDITAVD